MTNYNVQIWKRLALDIFKIKSAFVICNLYIVICYEGFCYKRFAFIYKLR